MTNFSNMWNQSNCLSKGQLIGYIRQTLDRDEVYLVESHINDCPICSDALDGLMEEDLDIAQQDISEIKVNIESKIKQQPEFNQPVFKAPKSSTTKNPTSPLTANPSNTNRNKWLIAASILGAISLGGLTVYSYLKSHDSQLVKNENLGKGEEAEYNKPENPDANEITTIKVNPPDDKVSPNVDMPKEDKKSEPIAIQKQAPKKDEIPPVPVQHVQPIVAENKDAEVEQELPKPTAPTEKVVALEENKSKSKSLKESVAEPSQGMSNYYTDTKKQEPEFAKASKKTPYGMSNSKQMPASQNSRELSYQSNSANVPSTNDEAVKYTPKDNFSQGMELYNQGKFKESINFFEEALGKSSGTKKEDIQYQLALAYEKIGKDKKAKRLFEELALGTKYKQEASQKLIKLTK